MPDKNVENLDLKTKDFEETKDTKKLKPENLNLKNQKSLILNKKLNEKKQNKIKTTLNLKRKNLNSKDNLASEALKFNLSIKSLNSFKKGLFFKVIGSWISLLIFLIYFLTIIFINLFEPLNHNIATSFILCITSILWIVICTLNLIISNVHLRSYELSLWTKIIFYIFAVLTLNILGFIGTFYVRKANN